MAEIFNSVGVFTMAEAAVFAGEKYGVKKDNWVENRNS